MEDMYISIVEKISLHIFTVKKFIKK